MDYFTEEHSKALLAREWLVKVDNDKATPYLLVRPALNSCPFSPRATPLDRERDVTEICAHGGRIGLLPCYHGHEACLG